MKEKGTPEYEAIRGFLIFAVLCALILVGSWAGFLLRDFVHAKIKNDTSIAEDTRRVADAAINMSCGNSSGWFYVQDRIYECTHEPKKTYTQKAEELKNIKGGFTNQETCERLNGKTACAAFAYWGASRMMPEVQAVRPCTASDFKRKDGGLCSVAIGPKMEGVEIPEGGTGKVPVRLVPIDTGLSPD